MKYFGKQKVRTFPGLRLPSSNVRSLTLSDRSQGFVALFDLMPDLRAATFWDRFMLAIGRRAAFLVDGDSMLPTLKSGDIVLVDPRPIIGHGDIVLAAHPFKKSVKMLKRVRSVNGEGRFVLVGDNPDASSDSRTFGSIGRSDILGKAICRLST